MKNNPEEEFQRINELVDRVFKPKDSEDEAFEELSQALLWRKRQISASNGPEEAFLAWAGHSHHPQQFDVERRAFIAGWQAAMERQR